jgi:lactate dehydrogenase-like 2-hydroxyacid dehydrogenase
MSNDKLDVLMLGPAKRYIIDGLSNAFNLHVLATAPDREAVIEAVAPHLRAIVCSAPPSPVPASLMQRLPKLEFISNFGVGYDNIDAAWAGEHGITVTNTPDVLNEEVADTALGLLLSTVRELPQADRYVRAGKWRQGGYPLTRATLRNRTVGMVGLGRIGKAIARRLDAFLVPVVYHARNPQPDVPYHYYPKLLDMAREVDTLMLITPGGAATRHLINAEVLEALGPDGILINMARGSVVDDDALIAALKRGTILAAGLDVYTSEPNVPEEFMAMDNVVLFPHLGSASQYTRRQMDQLVIDNLVAWASGKPPLTPVAETPWPPKVRGG